MIDTLSRFIGSIRDSLTKDALRVPLNAIADRYSSCMLGSAGLVIFGAGSANAKTGAAPTAAIANGVPLSLAAATVLTPAAGTTSQNTFNVYVFYVDAAGTISSAMGTEGATLAAVKWPQTPQGKAIVGAFTVNPTAGAFVGATTLLDAANTNVVYISPQGAFDPSVLLGVAT